MLKHLAIISCCALCGFSLGRWFSAPAGAGVAPPDITTPAAEARVAETVTLPQPARAGRVPFTDLYRSLGSASPEDHAAYLRSLQELPSGSDRRAALIAFFQCMASISPRAAADLVRQVGKDDMQRAAIAVLAATPASETPVLVKMLLDLPADVDSTWRSQQLRGQMFFWAALDPWAAAQFADRHEDTYPGLAAGGIIGALAAADPEAAIRWLEEHPAFREDQDVMGDYVTGRYQRDPAEARRYLTEHATEEAMQAGLRDVTRRTFLASADDAAEFIKQLPTRDARQSALEGILQINAGLFVTDETSHSSLYAGLAEWVAKFPQDEWPRNTSEFLGRWQALDPNGSVSWVAQLPPATRSAVAVDLVESLPGARFKEILDASTGDFRNEILAAYARRLPPRPEDRQAFIEHLALPPEDAAQLAATAR